MAHIKIGVLISGGGTNLQAIIDACESGKIDGEVVFVGSDRPDVKGLERAKNHGIPDFVVDYKKYLGRDVFEEEWKRIFSKCVNNDSWLDIIYKAGVPHIDFYRMRKLIAKVIAEIYLLKEMSKYQYDLIVLAGFMQILSPFFIDMVNIDPWQLRIMNIHPALLPNFPGMHGYEDTWNYGCTVGGCTVHFVDYGEDTGPIITQGYFPKMQGDTLETFKERGLAVEHQVYPKCIQLFAQGRLKLVERDLGKGKTRKVVEILPEKKGIEVIDEGADIKFMGIEDCPQGRCRK